MISLLNKFPIIPNQVRDLKKYENLFQDVSIEEILKQIGLFVLQLFNKKGHFFYYLPEKGHSVFAFLN